MIIFRYLSKEFYANLLAITVVVSIILITNQFVHYLNDAANGRITMTAVMKIMTLQIPLLLGFLVPLAFYLSVLLGLGRMYMQREAIVLFSCGMSRFKLLRYVMGFGLIIFLIVSFLTLWIEPKVQNYRTEAINQAIGMASVQKVIPSKFRDLGNGSVFYARTVSRTDNKMKDVFFVIQRKHHQGWDVTVANTATEQDSPFAPGHFLVFNQGHRYIGKPGQAQLEAVDYDHYGVRLTHGEQGISDWPNGAPTMQLVHRRHEKYAAAELHWRLAWPISVCILGLIAFPLSRANPRQGKFAKLVPAILIYIAYADLLFLGKTWLNKGVVAPQWGMWWIHGIFLALAVILNLLFFFGGRLTFWWRNRK